MNKIIEEEKIFDNKSRRTQEKTKDITEQQLSEEIELFKPPQPVHYGYGELMFTIG